MPPKYPHDLLEKAFADIRKGMPFRKVSRMYDIPRTTLRSKYQGKYKKDIKGPATNLPTNYEEELVSWMLHCKRTGFPITSAQLQDSVQMIVKEANLKTNFINDKPGHKWVSLFFKRHPQISVRKAQNLTSIRNNVTAEDICKWFDEIEMYLNATGLMEIMSYPSRIFNCDETAFFLVPKADKVIAGKGDKNVYIVGGNDDKENLTVLFGGNAEGLIMPPLIVFKYERIPPLISSSVNPDWGIAKSENGWMTAPAFYEYIANVFNPWLIKNNVQKPVILFLDGHKSHMSLHTSKFCSKNGIELVALFPNSTQLMQPMDVAIFHPMKTLWKADVQSWRMDNNGKKVEKHHVAPLLETVINKLPAKNFASGFKSCGLCPFNKEEVMKKTRNSENSSVQNDKDLQGLKLHLRFLEKEIGPVKLESFKSAAFDNEDKSLYEIWRKLQDNFKSPTPEPSFTNASASTSINVSASISINVSASTSVDASAAAPRPVDNDTLASASNEVSLSITPVDVAVTSTPEKIALNKDNIPSPFKKVLHWPGEDVSKKKKSLKRREQTPYAVTSRSWQEYHEKKEREKIESEKAKENRKKEREEKKQKKQEEKEKKKVKLPPKKKVRKQKVSSSSSETEEEVELNLSSSSSELNEVEDEQCLYCKELYSESNEEWVQCEKCKIWAHDLCAGATGSARYTCEFCATRDVFIRT